MLIFFSIVFLVVVDRLFAAARFSADSPEVQEQAQGRFQAHVENPKEGKALPSEYAVPVYKIVLKTGEVMARSGTPQVSPPIGVDKEIALANEPGNILVAPNNVFDRITSEEIWAVSFETGSAEQPEYEQSGYEQ